VLPRLPLLFMCIWLIAGVQDHAQTAVIARLPSTTRAEIVARAEKLANHTWTCAASNLHASCSKQYVSDWKPGQSVKGLPYRWGGMDSPEEFDHKLASGLAAGSHSRFGVLKCAAGVDCSGFVSVCWGLSGSEHMYGTSTLREIAGKPRYNWFEDMKPGDVLNKPGTHVVLFTGYNPDGTINVCEASASQARVVCRRATWSRFKGYVPLQYKGIDE
jgi:hypothetical protein